MNTREHNKSNGVSAALVLIVALLAWTANQSVMAALPSAFGDYTIQVIEPPDPNTTYVNFTWVNEGGMVVMQYYTPEGGGQGHTGVLENGTWKDIDIPGSAWCGGSIPSADGRVGLTFARADGAMHTAIYQRGTYHYLPDHPDYEYGINYISDYGLMSGVAYPRSDPNVRTLGLLFNTSLSVFQIFTVPGSVEIIPLGINNAGLVVGLSYWKPDVPNDPNAPEVIRGFLYDGGQSFTEIVVPVPDAGSTIPESINESGQIVGMYGASWWGNTGGRGFLLRNGEFKDFTIPDSLWTSVDCINDHLQLSGSYADKDGKPHGYIATPRVRH
jgi:hypothetical protein